MTIQVHRTSIEEAGTSTGKGEEPASTVLFEISYRGANKTKSFNGLSLRFNDLHSVGELYTEDDFRQLVVTIEPAPAFLGGIGDLEDRDERGVVGQASLGAGTLSLGLSGLGAGLSGLERGVGPFFLRRRSGAPGPS